MKNLQICKTGFLRIDYSTARCNQFVTTLFFHFNKILFNLAVLILKR